MRVDAIMSAGEHSNRAGRETGTMGAGVDATREPRDDDVARLCQPAGEPFRERQACGRRVARADNGDSGPVEQSCLPAHADHRGRAVDLAE